MKERTLAAILAQMPPVEAKKLTEKLAGRFMPPSNVADARPRPTGPGDPTARSEGPEARQVGCVNLLLTRI